MLQCVNRAGGLHSKADQEVVEQGHFFPGCLRGVVAGSGCVEVAVVILEVDFNSFRVARDDEGQGPGVRIDIKVRNIGLQEAVQGFARIEQLLEVEFVAFCGEEVGYDVQTAAAAVVPTKGIGPAAASADIAAAAALSEVILVPPTGEGVSGSPT